MRAIQQGDILVKPVECIPEGAVQVPRRNGVLVLAEGERTGHSHTIMAEGADLYSLTRNGVTSLFLEVTALTVPLIHQEHGTVTLEKGFAKIDRVQELDFFEGYKREVID